MVRHSDSKCLPFPFRFSKTFWYLYQLNPTRFNYILKKLSTNRGPPNSPVDGSTLLIVWCLGDTWGMTRWWNYRYTWINNWVLQSYRHHPPFIAKPCSTCFVSPFRVDYKVQSRRLNGRRTYVQETQDVLPPCYQSAQARLVRTNPFTKIFVLIITAIL